MDAINTLEIGITLFFQQIGAWLTLPMQAFSLLGDEQFYLLIFPALYWCIDARIGLRLGMMLMLSSSLNHSLKIIFHAPRPYWFDSRVHAYSSETTFGIPSGHAQNSASIWGLAAVYIQRRWVSIVMLIAVFLIGVSRIYLGVHFTRDVLLGWLLGALLVVIFTGCEKRLLDFLLHQSLLKLVLYSFYSSAAMILISIVPVWFLRNWQVPPIWVQNALAANPSQPINPLDVSTAFTLGGTWFGITAGAAWLYTRFGQFSAEGESRKRLARYFLGAVILAVLYTGLGAVFPRGNDWIGCLLRFVRYTLIGSWVTLFGPLVFVRLKLANPLVKRDYPLSVKV